MAGIAFNHQLVANQRVRLGLSQRKLAKLTGCSYAVILRMERGADQNHLTLGQLATLAGILAVPPTSLLNVLVTQDTDPAEADTTSEVGSGDHGLDPELDLAQARLLRQIQTHPDVSRRLSAAARELILPRLVKDGTVTTSAGLKLSAPAATSLALPNNDATG